jgi:hypothetical protein
LVTDYNTLYGYVVYKERAGCYAAKVKGIALARNRNCFLLVTRSLL